MFRKGDEALHPLYGRVVVERIEKIVFRNETKTYLVMRMMEFNMKIMIPIDSLDKVGIRERSSKTLMKEIINILKDDKITLPKGNWNSRHKLNLEKIVSGDIRLVAEVMKGLFIKNTDKDLSSEDKRLMSCAERILVGEIMVSEQIVEKKAIQILNEYIHNRVLFL